MRSEPFRRLFEDTPLGLALVRRDYRFVKVNSALCQMLGYSDAELLQMTFTDITHPEDLQAGVDLAERLVRREMPLFKLQKRYLKKDRGVVWGSLTVSWLHDRKGNVRYGLVIIEDVTEHKAKEDALRESQLRLGSIYDAVEDVIFDLAIEPEGQFRFVSVNTAFLKVTKLSREQVVGKTVKEVIPEPSLTIALKNYRQAIEEKTILRWVETSDYPAGRLTGEVSVIPVLDKAGTCTHLVGSVHDITGMKRAQDIQSQLASDLEHSRDEIRALAASLMKAQEDERLRISRELHDHIGHQLASLAVEIGNLTVAPVAHRTEARIQLEAIRARLVKTSREVHDIAYQMHTSILDDLGLAVSLKDLCGQFSEHYPDVTLVFEDSSLGASIPSDITFCFYRVAQESLQNVAKHSGARHVTVGLSFKTGALVLTILDDGAGFDPKAVKGRGGIGLISMEERARLVNGRLTIMAALGHGTQISLEAPLPISN